MKLSDHRGMHRTLSELQGGDPLVLVLSRGGFCPKDRRQHEGLLQLHREMQVGYCRLVTISTDNLLETPEFRAVSARTGRFSPIPAKIPEGSRDRGYTDPDHNLIIPHTLVLEPGLRVYNSTAATGSLAGRRWRSCASTSAPCCNAVVPIGTSAARSSERRGRRGTRKGSIRTEDDSAGARQR